MGKIKDFVEAPKQATTVAIAAVFIAVVAIIVSLSTMASMHKAIWTEAVK